MRYAILIVLALVLAIGAAVFLKGSDPKPVENPADDGEKVLIAKAELLPGTFIVVANHIDFVKMDEKDIKPGFMQKKNVNLAEIDGAVVRNLIKAGEPIQKEKIVTPKEGGFLSAVLYPGKRAISVGVDVVSANAGFIFPGDKVDLLLTHGVDNPGGGQKSFVTETFVEDVRVLAIDQQVNNPEHKTLVPKTVTLEVTPKQAEEILVAEQLGKISLILRSSGTTGVAGQDSTSRSYTKDSEVSKVLNSDDKDIPVTITRGKSNGDTRVSSGNSGAANNNGQPASPPPATSVTTTQPSTPTGAPR